MKKEKVDFIKKVSENQILRHFFADEICDFIACQFALESDFGTSMLAEKFHNFSGMKVPHKRPTSRSRYRDYLGFCIYFDLDYCVSDYIMRFLYFYPHSNAVYDLSAFKIHLQNSGYCPEKDYLSRIETIYNQFINN